MGLIVDEPPGMNARKTDVMIAAAAVTTTEDALKPLMIGAVRVARDDVLLPHRRDQEHLVVHRQSEQDAHHEDRQEAHDRTRGLAHDRVEPAPLEGRHDRAEGRAHREQVAQRRLDRHGDRAEDDHQQQDREADDDGGEGQQRVRQLLGHVDVDRRRAGHEDVGDAELLLPVGAAVAQLLHESGRRRGRLAVLRDERDQSRVGARVGRRLHDRHHVGDLAHLLRRGRRRSWSGRCW